MSHRPHRSTLVTACAHLVPENPKTIFIHPEKTFEAIAARVNDVRQRFSSRSNEFSEPLFPLQTRLAVKYIYDLTPGLAYFENFKDNVLQHVETLHNDFITIHRSFLQFKASLIDSYSIVIINQNKLGDSQQKSHQELFEKMDNVQASFTPQISELFEFIKEVDGKKEKIPESSNA